VEDFDLFSALRCWRNRTLTLKEWVRSLRGVQELACFAVDDMLPFLLMPVADCGEWYRWMRSQRGKGKREASKSPEISCAA